MIKKIVFLCFIFLMFQNENVYASDTASARIGDNYYNTLGEAIAAASSTDIINLVSNVSLDKTLEIHKTVNINLNNHTIEADEKVFFIQGGSLNLSGSGTIIESKPNYGAIILKGSEDSTKKDFSTLSVGSDITLQGWSGIFINHQNRTGYGILVNMNGKINAINDTNGNAGAGIYVNGNIKNETNSPIINLSNTVNITSTGTGIYAAGYAKYNINGAYISGEQSGLGIKSGIFNILEGTIIGSGEDKTPTNSSINGINSSGTAIQIESNPSYTGNIELYIKNGLIKSNNSHVIYEYSVNDGPTEVKEISITGGEYISNAGKSVFNLSSNFTANRHDFITGGSYSSDPSDFLKSGYNAIKNKDSLYVVDVATMNVFGYNENNNNNNIPIVLIILSSLIIIGIILYLNRHKIFSKNI